MGTLDHDRVRREGVFVMNAQRALRSLRLSWISMRQLLVKTCSVDVLYVTKQHRIIIGV